MKTKFPWNRKMKQSAVTSNPLLWFVLLLILLTLIRAMPAFAFHKKPKKNPEELLATMQEQLKLTDHQIEQIRPILEKQEENRSKIFDIFDIFTMNRNKFISNFFFPSPSALWRRYQIILNPSQNFFMVDFIFGIMAISPMMGNLMYDSTDIPACTGKFDFPIP